MFVPIHRRRTGPGGEKRVRRVALSGALAGIIGAVVASTSQSIAHGDTIGTGGYVLIGLLIAVVAVAGGIAVARSIGRQGKV